MVPVRCSRLRRKEAVRVFRAATQWSGYAMFSGAGFGAQNHRISLEKRESNPNSVRLRVPVGRASSRSALPAALSSAQPV